MTRHDLFNVVFVALAWAAVPVVSCRDGFSGRIFTAWVLLIFTTALLAYQLIWRKRKP